MVHNFNCIRANIIATGGVDKVIRLYNPLVVKKTCGIIFNAIKFSESMPINLPVHSFWLFFCRYFFVKSLLQSM